MDPLTTLPGGKPVTALPGLTPMLPLTVVAPVFVTVARTLPTNYIQGYFAAPSI